MITRLLILNYATGKASKIFHLYRGQAGPFRLPAIFDSSHKVSH